MKKKTEEVVKVKKVGRPPKAAKAEKPAAKLVAKKVNCFFCVAVNRCICHAYTILFSGI